MNPLRKKLGKIWFTSPPIKIKYFLINLNKKVKGLYRENYNILQKEIKEAIGRWKVILYSWIGRTNTIKMVMFPKFIYRFDRLPIKMPTEQKKTILKLHWNQRTQNKTPCWVTRAKKEPSEFWTWSSFTHARWWTYNGTVQNQTYGSMAQDRR